MFSNHIDFIDNIYSRLENLGIDTSKLKIDHLGYQADSIEDYDSKVKSVKDSSEKISENIVGDRRVGIFVLNDPIIYKEHFIKVFEVFEPRNDQKVTSGWEHIEFLVETTLEAFIELYPSLDWDTKMINREEFPMLILSLGDGLRAKFPRRSVLDEVKRTK